MSGKDLRSPRLGRWPSGVNNVAPLQDLQSLGDGEEPAVRAAVNIDFADTGKPMRRRGFALKSAGICHSLWSDQEWPFGLLVKDGQLTRLEVVNGAEQLTALQAVSPAAMVYTVMNDSVYLSNGAITGRVGVDGALQSWGVPAPGGQPNLVAAAFGGLDAGRYQVAVTYQNASGEESGAEVAAAVDVPYNGGITLNNIPQPAEAGASLVRIYVSPPNGDALYHATTIPLGVASYTLGKADIALSGRLLETQLHDRVPPARFLASYRGRIYFAIGNTLAYTAALRYGLYKRHENYFRFPGEITGVVDSTDGLYVGTDKLTYALVGADPKDMQQRVVDTFGVVPGTMSKVHGKVFGARAPQVPVAVWWNNNGELVRGDPQGSLVHLTRGRIALPRFSMGATMQREVRGISQLVSVLRGPAGDAGFKASDTAVAEVVRNGVVI